MNWLNARNLPRGWTAALAILATAREPAPQLFTPVDAEFPVDVRKVGLDRSGRKLQPLGNILRGVAKCGEQGDLAFATR